MNDNNDFNKNTEDYTKKISFQDGGTVSDEVRYNLNESGNDDETLDFDQRRLEYDPETEEEYRKSRKPHKGECEKKKSSFKISIIAIITMFILALGIVSSYPYIKNIVKEDVVKSPYENYALLHGIYESSYVLYKEAFINEKGGKNYDWGDIYLNPEQENLSVYRNVRNSLYKELNNFQRNLNTNFKNLDYTVIGSDGSVVEVVNNNNLQKIIELNKENDLSDVKDYYGFYMVVRYDNDGYPNVENVYGADPYVIRNIFSEFKFGHCYYDSDEAYNEDGSRRERVEINPIRNTTFIYGIPKELQYTDKISNIINYELNNVNIDKLIFITLIILFGILILGLCVPYRVGKKVYLANLISKIPLEINCGIFGILAILSGMVGFRAIASTIENTFENTFLDVFGIDTVLNIYTIKSINIIMWICVIYAIFQGTIFLKYILNYGIVKYLKEKSIIIKCLRIVKRNLRRILNKLYKTYKYITRIDLNDKSNKFLIKILGVNLIIIAGCCLLWIFGIFAAIIYTGVVFYISRKHYEKIRNNFQTLLNACSQMQDGNLDVNIEDDLGLFNPLKDSLQEIQKGFKKAVSEEVKSQKMKTELISNVSHDLKTPLTSIITYVDLLKKENISEEERKSYIDTLDKKSQRLKFLIEDLFEVSKATTGNIQLNLVNVDILELLRQVQVELYDKFKKSNLTIKNNFPENKVILELDSQKTFRIFENLLNNVSKYAMNGSRVYIDMKENNKEVIITIKNISAAEMNFTPEEIIERFQRGDKSRNTEGSGLGLAIAKSFVEIQGGQFIIEIDGDLFKVTIIFKK